MILLHGLFMMMVMRKEHAVLEHLVLVGIVLEKVFQDARHHV